MENKNFGERLQSYGEIVACSVVLFGLAAGLGVVAALVWRKLTGAASLQWEIVALAAGVFGLLPFLVIVARVWEVNISLFGNRAQAERPVSEDEMDRRGPRIE